jgi:tRNA A37 threonylcarbamoyltransferase TsaD
VKKYKVNTVVAGGGVVINQRFRFFLRTLAKKYNINAIFPPYNYLTADNAAMIGVAAYYKAQAGIFAQEGVSLDRVPRLSLENPYLIG